MVSPFETIAKQRADSPFAKIAQERANQKPQEPTSLTGSAASFATGFGGGAGGLLGDIQNLLTGGSATQVPIGLNPKMLTQNQNQPLLGTNEVVESLQKDLNVNAPQNALERILQQSGEFGGQEGVVGLALGGPVAAGVGAAHGSASGALYGGLKELGVPDTWALGITAATTISPIAGRKLIQLYKEGKSAKAAIKELDISKEAKSQIIKNLPDEPPPPPPPLPSGEIKVGTELSTGSPNRLIAEEVANKINKTTDQNLPSPIIQLENQLPKKEGGKSLIGRVSSELDDIITKDKFYSEAQAGREISNDVKTNFENAKKEVKAAYKEAEGITESHNDVYPEMAARNEARIADLERIPKRDPGAELVYQDALALRNIIGTPDGLFQANARDIMKQADSFSSRVKYDAPYQGVKSLVKTMIKDMNEGVISSLRKAGKNVEKVIKADQIYGKFADTFYSDEIAPFLSKNASKNAELLAKKTLSDQATYRSVKQAVGSRKLPVINKIDREIVQSRMGKYMEPPKSNQLKRSGSELVGSKQYNEDLSNLSELIGKEKTADVDYFLRKRQAFYERIARQQERIKQATNKKEAPNLNQERVKPKSESVPKTSEEIQKALKNPSSIKELKKKMLDKGLNKEFEALAKERVKEIFKEGQFEGRKLTGQQIKKIINKDHEILNELLGPENVDSLFKEAEIAGKEEIKQARKDEIAKRAGKWAGKSAGYAIGGSILKGIISIFL